MIMLPVPRGRLTAGKPLSELTWLRVGGPAEWLFQPADEADLAAFLRDLPPDVPVFPLGVGSNLIVRDRGLPGVTIRLGRGFNGIETGDGAPGKDEPARGEPGRSGPRLRAAGRAETGQAETGETEKGEGGTGEAGTGEAGRGEAGRGEAGAGEAGAGAVGTGEAGTGEARTGEAGRAEAGTGEAGAGEAGAGAARAGEGTVTAGAAALDAQVARRAAEAGLDLTFLRTIPGAVGGAIRMNAGCYGSYISDHVTSVRAVTRAGEIVTLAPEDLAFGYRRSALPEGWVITQATFRAARGDPEALARKMEEQLARRDATQPVKDRTAGSTFRNPSGQSSTGRAGDTHELKAWRVIEKAGLRGATLGAAQMSPMHPNFLVNTGGATAAELEGLGEYVRKRVYETQGIELLWEIMRVGEPAPHNDNHTGEQAPDI